MLGHDHDLEDLENSKGLFFSDQDLGTPPDQDRCSTVVLQVDGRDYLEL